MAKKGLKESKNFYCCRLYLWNTCDPWLNESKNFYCCRLRDYINQVLKAKRIEEFLLL